MSFPIRVDPAVKAYVAASGRIIPAAGHPLSVRDCPVCDRQLHRSPVSLVYVGRLPDVDGQRGWTAAAVAVHDGCTDGPASLLATVGPEPLAEQIGRLARAIMAVPGEPSSEGGAVDVAVRIIGEWQRAQPVLRVVEAFSTALRDPYFADITTQLRAPGQAIDEAWRAYTEPTDQHS